MGWRNVLSLRGLSRPLSDSNHSPETPLDGTSVSASVRKSIGQTVRSPRRHPCGSRKPSRAFRRYVAGGCAAESFAPPFRKAPVRRAMLTLALVNVEYIQRLRRAPWRISFVPGESAHGINFSKPLATPPTFRGPPARSAATPVSVTRHLVLTPFVSSFHQCSSYSAVAGDT
jgi:hypothetical protein